MNYVLHILVLLNIYSILILGANITVGMSGLLTLCQAAFYGIGAYVGAFLLMQMGVPFIIIALLVATITGLFSLLISYASLKLKNDYFTLASLGFQMIVFTILYNWVEVTNGPYGLSGIPAIKILGVWSIKGLIPFAFFTSLVMLIIVVLFEVLKRSPYGRLLRAIRSDETSTMALGRNTYTAKITAFFISAGFSGIAGLLYASYVRFIDPTSFTLNESLFIICALFIGGIGNAKGSIAGALFVVILPEILRFIGLPDSTAANLREIIYGLSLLFVVFYRPKGLVGETIYK
jgi:branched-chain amino acid transport system permease protein